ncbi:MAG: single-stranded DNA-binding protein, partial [Verrucomicrobiota bacterium]|nr:single-stranded DNA-binding protein [Verrucomicrobiota bacterium]
MPNYNKVILMGNLTRDPEVRYTSSGTAIAKLGIAVNRYWRNQEGQQ